MGRSSVFLLPWALIGCSFLDPASEDQDLTAIDPAYCEEVAEWPSAASTLEEQMLRATNERRQGGAVCGGTSFGPASPLRLHEVLRCSARKHSKDMVARDFFEHDNPDGESPADRMMMAGYDGMRFGENLAAGLATADEAVAGLMGSPGHCANIMEPGFAELGVGYVAGGDLGHYWTQNFGAR